VFCADQYHLRPGDIISVNVVDNPEFSVRSKIRPDGRINFPVLGDIEVAGLTTTAIVATMEEKLQPYVNNAAVSVTIEQYFANKIFLIGELNTNGEFEIFEPVDVIRAIAMAGGMKNPRTKEARIIKSNGQVIQVPVRKLLTTAGASKNESYILYPGDTLYVPKTFAIPWSAWHLIVATLSSTIALYLLILKLDNQ
jgi:polysaccharide export outer membrane protein